MLKTMRHHAKYFYVLFFIVILTFIFWGVGSVDKTDTNALVASVGSHKITASDYAFAQDRMYRFYRDLYKEKFDEVMQKKIKDMILEKLIADKVLLAAAEDQGIRVNDAELREAIMNEKSFMTNGAFDNTLYQNSLRLSRMTPEMYESLMRQELVLKKMRSLITLAAAPVAVPQGMVMEPQMMKALADSLSGEEKEKLVKSFVEGYKKKLKITVNQKLVS